MRHRRIVVSHYGGPDVPQSTLLELLRRMQLGPIVAARMPLSDARLAHERLSRGGVIGKIVPMPAAPTASRSAA